MPFRGELLNAADVHFGGGVQRAQRPRQMRRRQHLVHPFNDCRSSSWRAMTSRAAASCASAMAYLLVRAVGRDRLLL